MNRIQQVFVLISLAQLTPSHPTPAAPHTWQTHPGFRSAKLNVPTAGHTGFTLIPPAQSNIHFTNQLSYATSEKNQNMLNGSGLAAGDFDNDGLCDLYFCNLEGDSALYRNLGGWKFNNVTASAGVPARHQVSRGAVFADLNGDTHLDLLISSLGGPNTLYLNDGKGRFTDATAAAGLTSRPAGGHSIALADADGDGDLDLYIANYGENSLLRSGGDISVRTINGRPVIRGRNRNRLEIIDGELVEYGEPDAFHLNDGTGRFTEVSWTGGTFLDESGAPLTQPQWDMGLSAAFRDINQDGLPDIYVCNDFQTPDRIWINIGNGKFRALPETALRSTPHFSMGVDFADINRDGHDDFFVGDMLSRHHHLRMTQVGATNPPPAHVKQPLDRQQFRRNGLFLNRGDGTYAEIANFAGVDASDWTWTVAFLDVDLDGYEDLLIANGHAYDTQSRDISERKPNRSILEQAGDTTGTRLKDYPPLRTPNVLFRNKGDLTFEEVGQPWGFNASQVSHGIALADLDNDGDLDAAVSVLWEAPLLYRNETTQPRIAVRLRGKSPNHQGIGSRVTLLGGPVTQSQEISAGGRYLAGDDPIRVFAAGSGPGPFSIEVRWRSGRHSLVPEVQPNHIYEIEEPESLPESRLSPPPPPTLFTDVSSSLGHRHTDSLQQDRQTQPLLHKHLGLLGPGIAWFDLNQDQYPDLIIGGSPLAPLMAYHGGKEGRFTPWLPPAFKQPIPSTPGGLALATLADNTTTLLLGSSTPSARSPDGPAVLLYNISPTGSATAQPPIPTSRPTPHSTTGPLALADVDADGDLDLFIGGRHAADSYPSPASSEIHLQDNGVWKPNPTASARLRNVGMVSAAVFSDLNGDGYPELILACEWGPVRVFLNHLGSFSEITESLGLDKTSGWWNGVSTGDINGDGRMDIIASNWGLNSSYHNPARHGVSIYYADTDGNGTLDLLEVMHDPLLDQPVPIRDMTLISQGFPLIRTRFPSHAAFSKATPADILGAPLQTIPRVQAHQLASCLFINNGAKFEPVPLPDPAQFAPAFGINVADFDGDGSEDLFLSQNFFGMRSEEPRLDSGRGLLLRGSPSGQLHPVPGQESGILIYGDQRGSAVADWNNDGRPDLAVTQNRSATRLLLNQGGRPGLRVTLSGPPGNPLGIGAILRLDFGSSQGPAREIHAGSGYWSQDSAVQIMATPSPPSSIRVVWPGGKATSTPIPPGATAITVPHTSRP